MTQSLFKQLTLFTFILLQSSKSKEYGCYEGESCILSSHENSYTPQDALYCTSSVTSCNIYCLSPNSCESVIIYSSAQSTNIICNATSSCHNTIIRIGDTSIYPLNFNSRHFTNPNPISSNIHCEGEQSCSSLKYIFHGTDQDECTISSMNKNAFYDGYFDCNYMETDTEIIMNGANNGCNLFCDNQYGNECLDAILDCNEAEDIYCKCNGNGCYDNLQEVMVYYDNSSTTINPSIPTRSAVQPYVDETSFFEQDAFRIIIISIIVVVVLLGCALIICCWKFEAFYEFYERKKTKKFHLRSITSEHTNIKYDDNGNGGEGGGSDDDENNITKSSHINQHSHTLSQSQSGGDVEQTTTMTTVTVQNNIQKEENNNKYEDIERRITNSEPIQSENIGSHTHTHTTSALLNTSRERMPSSWYRYQEQKKQSMDMTNTTNTISPMTMTSPQTVTATINTTTIMTETTTRRTGTDTSILQSPSNGVLSPSLSPHKRSKNKRRKNYSINSVDENKENYNPNHGIKKPQKQNKKRNNSHRSKSNHHKHHHHHKIKDKKYIEINNKSKQLNAIKTKQENIVKQHDEYDTDSMTSSFDDETDSSDDSDYDTETSSYTGSDTTSSSDEDDEDDDDIQDGDNDPQTRQTLNVDDMLVNMVMMMQQSPVGDHNKNTSNSNPKIQPIPQYTDVV